MDSNVFKREDFIKILEMQKYKCALTGHDLTPKNCSPDHKIPICSGGSHDPANIQIVLKKVNKMKGGLNQEEFISLCRSVVQIADLK